MSMVTYVRTIPKCDMAGCETPAMYDAKTFTGHWANLCQWHFRQIGVGLGTGKGQELKRIFKLDELTPEASSAAIYKTRKALEDDELSDNEVIEHINRYNHLFLEFGDLYD